MVIVYVVVVIRGTDQKTFKSVAQGGRTWQPFVGSKNGNENFVKCVFTIFASNASFLRIIANLQS